MQIFRKEDNDGISSRIHTRKSQRSLHQCVDRHRDILQNMGSFTIKFRSSSIAREGKEKMLTDNQNAAQTKGHL